MFKRIAFVLVAATLAAPASALANTSGNLDQCGNGASGSPPVGCDGSDAWVNGNLNSAKSQYFEGDSVPYRARLGGLEPSTSYTINIEWDTKKADKHALDFITTYDRSAGTHPNDPCGDALTVAECAAPSTLDIPLDSGADNLASKFAQSTLNTAEGQQVLTMWGAALDSTGVYVPSGDSDSSQSLTITFHTTQDSTGNAVLSWGGHIATRHDWGAFNSAVNIPGSPYHMRIVGLTSPTAEFSCCGSQDRSLTTDAVTYPALITVVKETNPDDAPSAQFQFDMNVSSTNGVGSPFYLDTDGTTSTPDTQEVGTIDFGADKTVTETEPDSSWSLSGISCPDYASPLGGGGVTTDTGTLTATFTLVEGDSVTCTFTNHFTPVTPDFSTTADTTDAETTVKVGDTINDTAHLSGTYYGIAGGTITFDLYGPDDPSCDGEPVFTDTVDVDGDGDYSPETGFVSTDSGTYHWVASYSGDNTTNGVDGACGDEGESSLVIAEPTISTSATTTTADGPDLSEGSVITDTATLSGSHGGGGTITFNLYAPGDPGCDGDPIFTAAVDVDGDGDYSPAEGYTTDGAGDYHWVASYSGDGATLPAAGQCGDEGETSVVLANAIPKITKTGPATALDNETIKYTITVTNEGSGPILDASVTDQIKGQEHGCDSLSPPSGDADGDGNLDPSETWTYTCTYKVRHSDEDSSQHIVNVATVTGSTTHGDPITPQSAQASTLVQHPAIAIDKTGPATAQAGDKVAYVLTVTNPGDVSFAESAVTIADQHCNGDPVSLIGKGGDGSPGSLDRDDVWTYSCSVQTAVGDQAVHNVASVTGCDAAGNCASDDDDADTQLSQPEQLVLPERITPGVARLLGPTGCTAKAFNARIRGSKIKTVVFVLDGNVVKRLRKPNSKGLFQLRVNPKRLRIGVHRLVANVTFDPKSGTKPKSLRLSFQRCAKKFVAPRFTG